MKSFGTFIKLLAATFMATQLFAASAFATTSELVEEEDDDELVSQELKLEHMSFRYNSVDGSIWESCTVEKAKQTHDFIANCGKYRFTVHVVFRIWGPSNGAPADEKTYDLLVMADRHESNGGITAAVQSTWLEVASGGKVKLIKADVGFDNGNNILQTTVKLQ